MREFCSCRRGALRFASPLRSPARYGVGLLIPMANAGRDGRNFFLFACPKRKNQRETTLGRGRLRFLPLPRPTLIETPKRGAPLLEHPRADRIRPGVSCIFSVSPPERLPPHQGEASAATVGVFPPGGDGPRPCMGAEGFRSSIGTIHESPADPHRCKNRGGTRCSYHPGLYPKKRKTKNSSPSPPSTQFLKNSQNG